MLDGLLYAVGGWDGTRRLNSVECYDRKSNTWTNVACMAMAMTSPAVTAYNGRLYVCGGAIHQEGDGMDQVLVGRRYQVWFLAAYTVYCSMLCIRCTVYAACELRTRARIKFRSI